MLRKCFKGIKTLISFTITEIPMIFLIAHRGNFAGKNVGRENSPAYITEALSQGYHAEVDV